MPSDDPTVRPSSDPAHTAETVAGFRPRLALAADAAELVRLRAVMFASLGADISDPEWQMRCRAHLEEHLSCGQVIGAVVDRPLALGLAASALAELSTRIPSPSLPTGSYAYISSVSTDPPWRRRGMALAVVSLLLDELRKRGMRRVELHATPNGEPLYRSLRFVPRLGGNEMHLLL